MNATPACMRPLYQKQWTVPSFLLMFNVYSLKAQAKPPAFLGDRSEENSKNKEMQFCLYQPLFLDKFLFTIPLSAPAYSLLFVLAICHPACFSLPPLYPCLQSLSPSLSFSLSHSAHMCLFRWERRIVDTSGGYDRQTELMSRRKLHEVCDQDLEASSANQPISGVYF